MDILTLLVAIPFLTVIALMFSQNFKQARIIASIGMGLEFLQSVYLVFAYLAERANGNTADMVFT